MTLAGKAYVREHRIPQPHKIEQPNASSGSGVASFFFFTDCRKNFASQESKVKDSKLEC